VVEYPPATVKRAIAGHGAANKQTTAIGALGYYVSHAEPKHYQPSNITFGIVPPLTREPGGPRVPKKKSERNERLSRRALADLDDWLATHDETARQRVP
jgi:folate-dependent tRNA-U54 methylase TrmFO/GidA